MLNLIQNSPEIRTSNKKSAQGASWLVLFLGTILGCSALIAQTQEAPSETKASTPSSDKLVPYVPTPPEVVRRMLELAEVKRDDTVYDVGSGDGRIVIMAAYDFGAQAVGIELDDDLYKKSVARIAELGLEKRAKIIHGNMFEADLRPATVVTLYLLTSVNDRLRPLLEKSLRSGARVVSHDFQINGWTSEKVETVMSENGISHTVYLYIRP